MPDYDKLAAKYGGTATDAGDAPDKYDQLAQKFSGSVVDAAPKAAEPKGFADQIGDFVSDLPYQTGLTARHLVEGLGSGFDSLAGNPMRVLAGQPKAETGVVLADILRLPKARNAGERIVGDIARTVAGGLVPMGAGAAAAKNATGLTQKVGQLLTANPGQQLLSAGAAGAAGGAVREAGGSEPWQLAASVTAGVLAPAGGIAAGKLGKVTARAAGRGPQVDPARVDITINNALKVSGMKLGDLPADVAHSLRKDVTEAFQTGASVSADAVRRLADYRMVGATPTAAGLTRDPGVFTRQKNLAKTGINSKDPAMQTLGQTEHQNNLRLTGGLNDLGAAAAPDQYAGGERIMAALADRNSRAQQIIGGLYDRARDSAGRSAALDPYAFTQRAGDLLNDANVESFLTPDIRNKLNAFAAGKTPLTVEIAEQFKTGLGRIQRGSTDGNVRHALGLVRQALDDTPLLQQSAPARQFGGGQLTPPGALAGAGAQAGQVGQEAMSAFNKARGMNRSWMQIVERTPALQAVRDGVEPDRFVQQFIIGQGSKASVMGVAQLKNSIKGSPDAMNAVREQILAHLKGQALTGKADEVGNFSESGYNRALNAIGDRKLRLFFEPDQIAQMKAIGRVASYEQVRPFGAAVNESNSAAMAIGALAERILTSSKWSKIPGYGTIVQPSVNEFFTARQANRALNVPRSLALPMLPGAKAGPPLMISPAALLGGESEEQRKRREAGLLLP